MTYQHQQKRHLPEVTLWRTTAIVLMAINLLFSLMLWNLAGRVEPADLVHQVCNESRLLPATEEHGCAELQNQLNLKFICEARNQNPDNHCWVERGSY